MVIYAIRAALNIFAVRKEDVQKMVQKRGILRHVTGCNANPAAPPCLSPENTVIAQTIGGVVNGLIQPVEDDGREIDAWENENCGEDKIKALDTQQCTGEYGERVS